LKILPAFFVKVTALVQLNTEESRYSGESSGILRFKNSEFLRNAGKPVFRDVRTGKGIIRRAALVKI
jgi:hypothetical protein